MTSDMGQSPYEDPSTTDEILAIAPPRIPARESAEATTAPAIEATETDRQPGPNGASPGIAAPGRRLKRDQVKIALFGPTSGGKTTFLRALLTPKIDDERLGTWKATPSRHSNQLADELWTSIDNDKFPQGTTERVNEVWAIDGTYPAPPAAGLFRRPQPARRVRFDLAVVDSPGKHFLELSEEVLNVLADADGLILLFDPTLTMSEQELQQGAAPDRPARTYTYLQRVLPYLMDQRLDDGQEGITQHLAVCVSKFDDQAVYERARTYRLTDRAHGGQPFIPGGDKARRFFERLCEDSIATNDDKVPALLAGYFDPGRISYHVISAVGFYMQKGGVFDPEDYVNVGQRDNKPYIRRNSPMNVWESLIGLYESVTGATSR
jgi:GTPase SAR1 family protein